MYQIEQVDEKEVLCDGHYLIFYMFKRQVLPRDNKFVDALTQICVVSPKKRFLYLIAI